MTSLSPSGALAAWQFLALAVLVAGAAFASAYSPASIWPPTTRFPDGPFWDVFAGLAVVVPAVVLASFTWPWAGLALGVSPAGRAWRPLLRPPGCSAGRRPAGPAGRRSF